MQLNPSHKPIILQAQTLMSFKKAKNARIKIIRGTLWLTVAGKQEDFILEPGSVFQMPNNDLTLLEAKTECEVMFCAPETSLSLLSQWLLRAWSKQRSVPSYQPISEPALSTA